MLTLKAFQMSSKKPSCFSNIITQNVKMFETFNKIERITQNPQDIKPILIYGERGTGKELIAQAIHECSMREGEIISINCGEIQPNLIESEFFGHSRDSFTGAKQNREGLIKQAENGTLFLDEFTEISNNQSAFLRLLEYKTYRPVGSDHTKQSNAVIVATTNVNITEKIRHGQFRSDLYDRFFHKIELIPLRERKEDIPLLVNHFIKCQCMHNTSHTIPQITFQTMELLKSFNYPGNIRALKNIIEKAICYNSNSNILHYSLIKDLLEEDFISTGYNQKKEHQKNCDLNMNISMTKDELIKQQTQKALQITQGHRKKTSALLGISTQSLYNRMKKYELN